MATQKQELEALKAELAALKTKQSVDRVVDSEEILAPDSIDGAHDGLMLLIRDEAFECRRVDVSYQMMKFAVAQKKAGVVIPKGLDKDSQRYKDLMEQRNEAGMSLMATMLETVTILLKPAERGRFDNYMAEVSMSDNPLKPGEFQDAIGEVIAAVGGQEGKDKKERTTSSRSSSSSTETNVSYVDFSSDKAGVADKVPANS